MLDRLIVAADNALRTLAGANHAGRPTPVAPDAADAAALDASQRALSGALMRVNHVGEVCAQALYHAQALVTHDPALRAQFEEAAREEGDHLAWTRQRLDELGSRPSLLNPLWYAGAFALGVAAGKVSDATSLGFVVETERQVEQHLDDHLSRLPEADTASRTIVEQMRLDEIRHGQAAEAAGATPLPTPVRWMMRGAAKLMTSTAHHW